MSRHCKWKLKTKDKERGGEGRQWESKVMKVLTGLKVVSRCYTHRCTHTLINSTMHAHTQHIQTRRLRASPSLPEISQAFVSPCASLNLRACLKLELLDDPRCSCCPVWATAFVFADKLSRERRIICQVKWLTVVAGGLQEMFPAKPQRLNKARWRSHCALNRCKAHL